MGRIHIPILRKRAGHTEFSSPFLRDLIIIFPQVAWNHGNRWLGVKKKGITLFHIERVI
jgi:hypothetical protein